MTIHRVQEKSGTLIFSHNLCKCGRIFKFFSVTDSTGNCLLNYHDMQNNADSIAASGIVRTQNWFDK